MQANAEIPDISLFCETFMSIIKTQFMILYTRTLPTLLLAYLLLLLLMLLLNMKIWARFCVYFSGVE